MESKIKVMRFIMISYELVITLTIYPKFHLLAEFASICSVYPNPFIVAMLLYRHWGGTVQIIKTEINKLNINKILNQLLVKSA